MRTGVWTLMLVSALLCVGPGPAGGQTRAETDSLVWYVEQLEYDLAIARIRGQSQVDSLAIRLEFLQDELDWAKEDRRRWYHNPGLWFIVGAAIGIGTAGLALRFSM